MFESPLEEGWRYWVRWQVPVCAMIIFIPSVFAVKFIRKSMAAEPLLLSDLWVTHWRNLSPLWLLLYRAFAFVCCFQMLYEVVAIHGFFSFFFYTQWTMALVTIYFGLGTIVSAYGYWYPSRKTQSKNEEGVKLMERKLKNNGDNVKEDTIKVQNKYAQQEFQEEAGYLGTLMQMAYLAGAGASVVTDVVFWCVLVPFLLGEDFHVSLLLGSVHALNAGFLLGDTALNSLSFPSSGFAYLVVFGCLYLLFQWTLHACCVNWWPYPFLELSTPWAPLWYIGLAVIHLLCYGLYAVIVKAKYSLLPRLFPHSFVKSF